MPRPDVARLGVAYRRIPILSIGRDVYLDTRLILAKLESLYPASAAHPGISSTTPEGTALEQLLCARVVDGGLFMAGAMSMKTDAFNDAAFQRDRASMLGVDLDKPGAVSPFSSQVRAAKRPEAVSNLREYILWLEEGLLADGRPWILSTGGGGPSLADIEAAWVLDWIGGTLEPEILSAESAPRVHAWLGRFVEAYKSAEAATGKVTRLEGEEAAKTIVGAAYAEPEGEVRSVSDPIAVAAGGMQKGESVKVFPADYGFLHQDTGRLVALTALEVVIEVDGEHGAVRVHAPRHGFKLVKAAAASKM